MRQFELDGFSGTLMHSSQPGYDDARKVFNGMIDPRPAVIARCASADDVVLAGNLARAEGLSISVYRGGHGVTGAAVCDDGLCRPARHEGDCRRSGCPDRA